jgi:hypothetical protein
MSLPVVTDCTGCGVCCFLRSSKELRNWSHSARCALATLPEVERQTWLVFCRTSTVCCAAGFRVHHPADVHTTRDGLTRSDLEEYRLVGTPQSERPPRVLRLLRGRSAAWRSFRAAVVCGYA